MNLLLLCEIPPDLPPPRWNAAVEKHILEKTHPAACAASCTAWSLLSLALAELNVSPLPEVRFDPGGKPYLHGCPLHFSLTHSGELAAALISSDPCAVDIQQQHPELLERLEARCLTEKERLAGLNVWQAWTRRECIVKLSGDGFCVHPAKIDALNPLYKNCFFEQELQHGQERYALAALCMNALPLKIKKILPEVLF